MRSAYLSHPEWAAEKAAGFPDKWRRKILSIHAAKLRDFRADDVRGPGRAIRAANTFVRETAEILDSHALPLNASDEAVCEAADKLAARCMELGQIFRDAATLRRQMSAFAASLGIAPPPCKFSDMGAIRRLSDPLWWRRQLRKVHAKRVEGAAIILGFVNRSRECYVSDESVKRRAQQNRRNAAALAGTLMENDEGQQFTLAELAAKGTANKAIRRGELMLRIAGFEKIADDLGHVGLFVTATCPSRMHKWRTVQRGGVFENPKYDGTRPNEAQAYLSGVWAKARAKLARDGVGVYGFRIAEPNHDGTPHWHMILFCEPFRLLDLISILRHYFLMDSPDEKGAHENRLKPIVIDKKRGSAAGYVAKYVAKNIDGMNIEADLFGNESVGVSMRVEAWASTWGIRQFQQIGGAPVTVWRELRRVKEIPIEAPACLVQAFQAVNKSEEKGADFAAYVQAQGGVFCGRDYRIRLAQEEVGGVGRYGDPIGPKPVGVSTWGVKVVQVAAGMGKRMVEWVVKSVRHVWRRVGVSGFKRGDFSAPWTRVNNCTRKGDDGRGKQGGTEGGRGTGKAVGQMESRSVLQKGADPGIHGPHSGYFYPSTNGA